MKEKTELDFEKEEVIMDIGGLVVWAVAGWVSVPLMKIGDGLEGNGHYCRTERMMEDEFPLISVPIAAYEIASEPLYWLARGYRKLVTGN